MPAQTAAATARPADLHSDLHSPAHSPVHPPAHSPAPAPGVGRRRPPEPPGGTSASGTGSVSTDPAGDVVRWAVFCCVLVPVVLVGYGTSLGGAAGTALGLAAVTAVCRVLLRRAERGLRAESAGPRARRSHGGRNHRQG